jgi:hypothetical protein
MNYIFYLVVYIFLAGEEPRLLRMDSISAEQCMTELLIIKEAMDMQRITNYKAMCVAELAPET